MDDDLSWLDNLDEYTQFYISFYKWEEFNPEPAENWIRLNRSLLHSKRWIYLDDDAVAQIMYIKLLLDTNQMGICVTSKALLSTLRVPRKRNCVSSKLQILKKLQQIQLVKISTDVPYGRNVPTNVPKSEKVEKPSLNTENKIQNTNTKNEEVGGIIYRKKLKTV